MFNHVQASLFCFCPVNDTRSNQMSARVLSDSFHLQEFIQSGRTTWLNLLILFVYPSDFSVFYCFVPTWQFSCSIKDM